MAPIERSTWTFRTMVGLLGGSIATTWAIAWGLYTMNRAARAEDEVRFTAMQASDQALREELSKLATSVSIQSVQVTALQERIFDRIGDIEEDAGEVRSELREVRADIRALNGAKGDGEK